MSTLIMKFGGASVRDESCFANIANIIIQRSQRFSKTIVVISAMGNTTDQFLQIAKRIHPNPPTREQDMLISAGERISIALLAMALKAKGKEAISFTGSQSGIITSARHSDARIIDVRPHRITKHLREGKVVIVAGFQGMSLNGEITTLGRGGSDTSAVALGAAFSASKIEFYKDVDGIFDKDPKKYSNAKALKSLTYKKAIEIAKDGGVLHARSIELAQKNHIPLHILSFISEKQKYSIEERGTLIADKKQSVDVEGAYEFFDDAISVREGVVV